MCVGVGGGGGATSFPGPFLKWRKSSEKGPGTAAIFCNSLSV